MIVCTLCNRQTETGLTSHGIRERSAAVLVVKQWENAETYRSTTRLCSSCVDNTLCAATINSIKCPAIIHEKCGLMSKDPHIQKYCAPSSSSESLSRIVCQDDLDVWSKVFEDLLMPKSVRL